MMMHVTSTPPDYMEIAGRFAMDLGLPKPRKFRAIEGNLRRFHDRTPGGANLTIIQGGKDQQCQE